MTPDTIQPRPRPWLVWAYSGLLIAAGGAQMLRKVLTDTGGPSSRYGGLILAIVVAVGLIARSYGRAAGPRWIWKALAVGVIVAEVALIGFGIWLAIGQIWTAAGLLLGTAVLIAPAVAGLWDYSFRRAEVWRKSRGQG